VTNPHSNPPGIVADSSGPALTGQLAEIWDSLADLCRQLDAADWSLPTDCPGWTVADQIAHVVGTEMALAGRPEPAGLVGDPPAHVHNDIGQFNERWIMHYRSLGTDQLVADLHEITAERLRKLRTMDESAFDAPSWTPVGDATYRRFMEIRVFDCWVHEQDVRHSVGRPGHGAGPAAEQALDQWVHALGVIVGKRAGAPQGSSVTFDVTGPLVRQIHVAVAGRAAVVGELAGPPTTTIHSPSDVLLRVACGRRPGVDALAEGTVSVDGDVSLGRHIVERLAFTI